MTRLSSTMKWDARLQWRNGFYAAALVVVIIWVLLISQIPAQVLQSMSGFSLAWLLPAAVLGNLLVGTFYFMGGLLLLEKGEGTLEAQIVTPLRSSEYLLSKLGTLVFLSVIENSLLVGIVYLFRSRLLANGIPQLNMPILEITGSLLLFGAGLILGAAMFCLAGFLVVIRYDSINEYLLPSIVVTAVIMLPLVAYLTGWESWLLLLHPLQAPLTLLQAAWQPTQFWQLLYGLVYGLLWSVLLFRAANNAFYRFVIIKQGVMT
jgi:fluoroquinolone transport system permease protein